jgi:hypothetical protein
MKTLATAFVELAAYLENAKFDDPDDAQAARGIVSWCLVESSLDEKAMIGGIARQKAKEAEQRGADEVAKFYHSLSHWTKKPFYS